MSNESSYYSFSSNVITNENGVPIRHQKIRENINGHTRFYKRDSQYDDSGDEHVIMEEGDPKLYMRNRFGRMEWPNWFQPLYVPQRLNEGPIVAEYVEETPEYISARPRISAVPSTTVIKMPVKSSLKVPKTETEKNVQKILSTVKSLKSHASPESHISKSSKSHVLLKSPEPQKSLKPSESLKSHASPKSPKSQKSPASPASPASPEFSENLTEISRKPKKSIKSIKSTKSSVQPEEVIRTIASSTKSPIGTAEHIITKKQSIEKLPKEITESVKKTSTHKKTESPKELMLSNEPISPTRELIKNKIRRRIKRRNTMSK